MAATKLKMLAAGATEGPLTELLPEFMRTSGHEVDAEFGTVGAQKDRFLAGEKVDVIALSTVVLEALDKEGRFRPGSRVEFGRASCGVAIRDGFLTPNIGTPQAFKKALLAARSVAMTDPAQGGSSGIYFAKLLERMGIAAEMKDKLIYGKAGRDVGMLVRNLRAELGVTFTSEFIPIEGLRVIGSFPKEYEFVNGYGAAIANGGDEKAARALLSFLTSDACRRRFATYGLE
jgi:molybdate transport system substrate-binding protein